MHADYSDDAPAAGKAPAGKAPEGKNSSAPGGKNATAPAAAGKGKSEDAGGSGSGIPFIQRFNLLGITFLIFLSIQ